MPMSRFKKIASDTAQHKARFAKFSEPHFAMSGVQTFSDDVCFSGYACGHSWTEQDLERLGVPRKKKVEPGPADRTLATASD